MSATAFVTLTDMVCKSCGGVYAISEEYRAQAKEDGKHRWRCPYCKTSETWGYSESENQQLQRELDEKRRALTAAQCRIVEKNLLIERQERKLIRVQRGVCPCCRRSFQNLRRHMATKHPKAKP